VAQRATAVAERLLDAAPLARTVALRAPEPPDVGWTFRRRSCCLYYRVPGGAVCGDCVLHERRHRH
jgi:ferric iron reductase protein FhuF